MTLSKIYVNNQPYFLFTDFENGLAVSLTNGCDVYHGKATENQLLSMADEVDMSQQSFFQSMKKAFCGNIGSSELFSFEINVTENAFKFIWKQVIADEMKFQLGALELQKEEQLLPMLSLLEGVMSNVQMLSKKVVKLEDQNTFLLKENSMISKRMESYLLEKDKLEQQLFSKFCLVLNEKKARICSLKSELEQKFSKSSIQKIENKSSEYSDTESDHDNDLKKKSIGPQISCKDSFDNLSSSIEPDDVPKRNRRKSRSLKPKGPVAVPRFISLPMQKPSSSSSTNTRVPMVSEDYCDDDLLDEL